MSASRVWQLRVQRGGLAVVLAGSLCAVLSGVAGPASAKPGSDQPPPVTTCANLDQGAQGHAVKTIQKAVGTTVDGDYGPATAKAVKKWQKSHDVPPTGVVDAATWAALPGHVGRKACGQKVSGSGVTVSCASLSAGASGLAVVVLQHALGVSADGDFGSLTQAALEKVQTTAGLAVSGVTTSHTWKALHLRGTPVCSTRHTVGTETKDEKAQAKIASQVLGMVATLDKHAGTTHNQVALQAMAFAKKQLGKPYMYGGTGPKGFDCSGLQMKAYQHAGLTIPRTAAQQYAGAGVDEPLDHAKQGDLLFYASDLTKPATVYHVSMYIGGGEMLEAPHTGEDVQTVPLSTTDLLPVVVRPVADLSLPIKPGASGWSVTQLQEALDRKGSALDVDGGYGPDTQSAVVAWQRSHDLQANGVVHMDTWLTLG